MYMDYTYIERLIPMELLQIFLKLKFYILYVDQSNSPKWFNTSM